MEWQARWHSAREAGWLADWVGGEEVGEARPPVPSCCVVIRHPLGSSGLFELYVPLIIHLGCSALGQAHKDLIYSLAGNETTWGCCAESRDCWPCCQVIELMDGLQRYSTPSMTPPFSREHPFLALPYLSSSPTLAANKSFYGHSLDFATSFFKASLRACADWCHKLLRRAEHFIWLQQNLSDSHYVSTSESTYKNKIWGFFSPPVQVVGVK